MPKPYSCVEGPVLLVVRDDVDTDAIYPSRFLNTIKRFGLGDTLFADWRTAGYEEFVRFRNEPKIQASVLIAGSNFGCGSSREHAVWALADCGIGAIIALSYGDIFQSNCIRNGILTAVVRPFEHALVVDTMKSSSDASLAVDLVQRRIKLNDGIRVPFQINEADARQLLSGKDTISSTLEHDRKLSEYEKKVALDMPWLSSWETM